MQHVWSLICSKVIIDQQTKLISIIEAHDAIDMAGQFPAENFENPVNVGPLTEQLVSLWYRSDIDKPETGKFRIGILGPNGRRYGPENEIKVELINTPAMHSVLGVGALPFVGLGVYYFVVEKCNENETAWETVARIPLHARPAEKKD